MTTSAIGSATRRFARASLEAEILFYVLGLWSVFVIAAAAMSVSAEPDDPAAAHAGAQTPVRVGYDWWGDAGRARAPEGWIKVTGLSAAAGFVPRIRTDGAVVNGGLPNRMTAANVANHQRQVQRWLESRTPANYDGLIVIDMFEHVALPVSRLHDRYRQAIGEDLAEFEAALVGLHAATVAAVRDLRPQASVGLFWIQRYQNAETIEASRAIIALYDVICPSIYTPSQAVERRDDRDPPRIRPAEKLRAEMLERLAATAGAGLPVAPYARVFLHGATGSRRTPLTERTLLLLLEVAADQPGRPPAASDVPDLVIWEGGFHLPADLPAIADLQCQAQRLHRLINDEAVEARAE